MRDAEEELGLAVRAIQHSAGLDEGSDIVDRRPIGDHRLGPGREPVLSRGLFASGDEAEPGVDVEPLLLADRLVLGDDGEVVGAHLGELWDPEQVDGEAHVPHPRAELGVEPECGRGDIRGDVTGALIEPHVEVDGRITEPATLRLAPGPEGDAVGELRRKGGGALVGHLVGLSGHLAGEECERECGDGREQGPTGREHRVLHQVWSSEFGVRSGV